MNQNRTRPQSTLQSWIATGVCIFFLVSCSSAKKKSTPELSAMNGKKVALIEVDGEGTARKVVEVALVNQLIQHGSFILVSKLDLETARSAPEQNPLDWEGLAKRAGADYALRAKVLKFEAEERSGYATDVVYDSQLAEERGTDGKTEQVFKAKALEGLVQVQLDFTNVQVSQEKDTRSAIAEARDRVEGNAKNSSIHLPPRLRFLENLSNKAFKEFFERYN